MSCEVIVFTHSDYNDIWPIVCNSFKETNIYLKKSFAVNASADTSILENFNIYKYDDKNPYASRLVEILEKVESDYLVFFHDIDILCSFDNERFLKLLSWMVEEDVDRFYFGVFGSNRFVKRIGDMPIGSSGKNACEWFTTPYDVGPSIWKRTTFLELVKQFSEETYRSIESSGIQDVLEKKKIYAFSKMDIPVRFTIGRPFTEWFSFCHILVRGKWLPLEAFQSHSDFLIQIPQKYKIDIGMRGIAEFYHGMTNGFCIS